MLKTKKSTAADVSVELFKNSMFPGGLSADNIWLGIYQVLMWPEPINPAKDKFLLHIIEANSLRPPQGQTTNISKIWKSRAQMVGEYMASCLGISQNDLNDKIGLLSKHPRWIGKQMNNTTGNGFVGLMAHCLREFTKGNWEFVTERPANTVFPNIRMVGRSQNPKIDILGIRDGDIRAIISTKWSLRHDRIGDITTECTTYKAEALRNRIPLAFYFVTNEFEPSRLNKMLDDTCLDGIVHVHKKAVVDVCVLNGRLSRLIDLSEIFEILETLQ